MVGVPSPCPTGALRHVCIALAALVPSLPAQQVTKKAGDDPRARIVERAVADLADPARALDAQRRLFHLGAFAVEPLREQLHRDEVTSAMRSRIVIVLGKLGRAGLPAVRELRNALRAGDYRLALDAGWALARVLPFADPEVLKAVQGDVRRLPNDVQQSDLLGALLGVVWLPSPDAETLQRCLENGGAIAGAYRWLCARGLPAQEAAPIAALLRKQLDEWMQRAPIAWLGMQPGCVLHPDVAEAWLAVTNEALDGVAARALLDHWDPDERLRAIWWLREHGASLPFRERADLVGRLWDAEPEVAIAAAQALGAWGKAGLVGLPPLRAQQQTHADPAVAAACGAAAQAIVADESTAAGDRAFVAALDAALLTGVLPAPGAKASPAGRQLAAEVLFFGQWQAAEQCGRLLDVVESANATGGAEICSVAGWLMHREPPAVDRALAWLARRGSPVRAEMQINFTWLARNVVVADAQPAATEAMAWLTTAGAGAGELRGMCDDDNLRVAARALCALLAQPAGTPLPSAERLQALVSLDRSRVRLRLGAQDNGTTIGNDVSGPVRTLAAIALADAKLELPPDDALGALVKERCGVALPSLQQHVASLRSKNELPALLDRLETEIRQCMGVDPALRWPTAGAAK